RDKNLFEKAVQYEIFAGLQTSIVRRKIFDFLMFDEDVRIGEDRLLVYHAILKGFKFAYLLEIHATYRVHGEHISNVCQSQDVHVQTKKLLEYSKLYTKLLEIIPKSRKEYKKIIEKKLADLFFWNIAYGVFWSHKYYKESFEYFKKGISLNPLNVIFWKTYLTCFLKYQLLYKKDEPPPC
ncbi:MAG: hypothetical protein Q9M37_08805, partial [Desulfonauticus sp.]|nr:hypothetical protein [Desulfonauticus sp.]